MTIDKTLKIKEKYFNAILKLEKPFELRHFYLAPNSIVKLDCIDSNNIDTGRYLIFKSGKCELLKRDTNGDEYWYEYENYKFYKKTGEHWLDPYGEWVDYYDNWYDTFCWEYITKAPTYLIEIAEILEVK